MAKKVVGYIKLQVPAGAANPSPPIGPALGQRGLNIMEFCKAFNARTAQLEKGSPIPVVITAFQDRSFTFEMRQPPVTFWLKKAANLKIGKKPASGSKTPGRGFVGKVTKSQVREIAEKKIVDLNCELDRVRHEDDRRLRPLDGPAGGGVRQCPSTASESRTPANPSSAPSFIR